MSIQILVTDHVDPSRETVATTETAPAVVAGWLHADGMRGYRSPNIDGLAGALARGDWTAVHMFADRLSVNVEVLA